MIMPTVVQGNFEWDPDKNANNKQKHGIGFEEAIMVFSGLYFPSDSYLHDSGEFRQYVVGLLGGKELTVVFTMRGLRRRIISARLASKEERYEFRQRIAR